MARNKQVAALPWRRGEFGTEILLVTTRTTKRWLIPKGWPMDGKSDHQAAAIEAFEEAGVRGRTDATALGRYGYQKLSDKGKARYITVAVYALHVEQELSDWPEREERQRRWMSVQEASKIAGEPELVPLLEAFAEYSPKKSVWQWLWNLFRN
jgi:8-oxo-dGTP pyrophosphatase MutT (NUDIX family)